MSSEGGGLVLRDAERAVSIVGRIVNIVFLVVFVLGLSVIGIGTFMAGTGSIGHRLAASLGYVAFFGIGFGLLFLSQWVLRQVLWVFFSAGAAALTQDPAVSANAPSDARKDKQAP
jgi:hypothetical protein